MNKEYILRSSNIAVEAVKSEVIQALNERISAEQDCKVEIIPLDFRSMNALRAYWVMVNSVVKWDADNHGYRAGVWDEWFKREAGLTEEIDLMPMWKMKYRDKLQNNHVLEEDKNDIYNLVLLLDNESFKSSHYLDHLGERYIYKTRSISKKGDVTKEEMGRLLMTVIEFGAANEVPNCFIKDTELENMLRSYNR